VLSQRLPRKFSERFDDPRIDFACDRKSLRALEGSDGLARLRAERSIELERS
jgi:hypothetical protein